MTDKQETLEEMDQRFHDGGVSWDDLVKWYWLLKADFEQAEAERDRYRDKAEALEIELAETRKAMAAESVAYGSAYEDYQ